MSAAIPFPYLTLFGQARGRSAGLGSAALGVCRLPTDPIGSCTATLSGVHAGCEIRIRDKDTNELAGTESCVENPAFTLPVYSPGSAYNTVRIIVISTSYELIDLQYTVSVGSFSIPIEMSEDPWFKDPV